MSTVYLGIVAILWCYVIGGMQQKFEDTLEKHGLDESTINILKTNAITSAEVLSALHEDDLKELSLSIGQRALLRQLVVKLQVEKEPQNNQGAKQARQEFESAESDHYCFESEQEEDMQERGLEAKLDDMTQEQFWCIFKCLGGIGAVGVGGILALLALVKLGLPAIGFTAAGITAASLAAKIMSLIGVVKAGSIMATLQSVAMAGVSWKAMLLAMFGSSTVYAAVQGACRDCFNK